ncbi:MAG TPA: hypothetical protein VLN45_05650 [Ignavibacteriaceae bacterium]|nr:hypothetical protein [Ignavibacteriaceae bacterium]
MKTYLLIFLIAPLTLSQWQVGASYKIKSDVPENGIGFFLSRNLPVQRADFGLKVRAEINLFRQNENKINYLSEDYNLNAIGSLFFKNFTPYFGFGAGYGELNINHFNWQGFVFNLLTGINFPISDFIKPYVEIQGIKYFADFDSRLTGKNISTYQFRGVIGISISINTLKD